MAGVRTLQIGIHICATVSVNIDSELSCNLCKMFFGIDKFLLECIPLTHCLLYLKFTFLSFFQLKSRLTQLIARVETALAQPKKVKE